MFCHFPLRCCRCVKAVCSRAKTLVSMGKMKTKIATTLQSWREKSVRPTCLTLRLKSAWKSWKGWFPPLDVEINMTALANIACKGLLELNPIPQSSFWLSHSTTNASKFQCLSKKNMNFSLRLKKMPQSMPEYSMTRNYLDLMMELPWSKSTKGKYWIDEVEQLVQQ